MLAVQRPVGEHPPLQGQRGRGLDRRRAWDLHEVINSVKGERGADQAGDEGGSVLQDSVIGRDTIQGGAFPTPPGYGIGWTAERHLALAETNVVDGDGVV